MKIAVVFTGIGVLPERRNNVSGHVQIPLKTCELLRDAGHSPVLIATRQEDGKALPACLPTDVPLELVADGRRRGQFGRQNQKSGYQIWQLVKQVRQTVAVIKKQEADIVHVFGFERMVKYGGLLKFFCGKPVVVTLLGQKPSKKWSRLYRYVDRVTCLTKSVADQWGILGERLSVIRPGVVRDMTHHRDSTEPVQRNRVLFWREASAFGGADLCVEAFDQLAPKFPDIQFDFAVRRYKDEVPGLDDLAQRHTNVTIHRFPYEGGLSLEQLIDESLVTVLPYRELSIEPQLAVVETLSVGCPVICSDIRCLPELVEPGITGWTIPSGDAQALTKVLGEALSDPKKLNDMRESVAVEFKKKWSWSNYDEQVQNLYRELLAQA